jgi:ribulose-phosphate 3-epimerase
MFKPFPINSLIFHCEAVNTTKINECLDKLHSIGIAGGIAIKPHTDANTYKSIIERCQYVCVMGVEPGMGGQSFMPEAINNLIKVYNIKQKSNPKLIIQLDGGVDPKVISKTAQYVDHFVVGSYLMKQTDKKALLDFANKY